MENEDLNPPTIPERVRTVAYIVGLFSAAAGVAALGAGYTRTAGALTALSGACNALAFGYRPTRPGATPSGIGTAERADIDAYLKRKRAENEPH